MTISSPNRIAGPYTGNGSTTTFAFSFKVFAAADLQVVQLIVASGLETPLTLNTDYTVTLNQNQNSNPGGSVTLVAGALPSGYTLTITSTISNLQPTDLTNQGGFYPEVITDSLDRATIQIQQISDIGDRAIKVPLSDGAVAGLTLPTAAQRANAFLAFDANGDPVAVTGGTSGAPATVTRQTFSGNGSQTTFALASAPGGLGNSALVYINGICQERSTYSIGGSSLVFSQAPVAGTDNIEFVNFLTTNIGTTDASLVQYTPLGTGAVARSAATRFQEVISVKDFGATADGVTNDATAFTNAATAAGTRNVFVPGGSYAITGTVTGNFYTDSTVTIVGGTVNTINRIGSVLSTAGNLSVGGTIVANAVQFPATQVPSGNPNTLDDYKEGTWTPVLSFGNASVGITYDTTNTGGRYVKIGKNVFAWARVILTSKGSSTGSARITLPINSSLSLPPSAVCVGFCYQTSPVFTGGYVPDSSNHVRLVYSGSVDVTNTEFTNATDIIFSAVYSAAD